MVTLMPKSTTSVRRSQTSLMRASVYLWAASRAPAELGGRWTGSRRNPGCQLSPETPLPVVSKTLVLQRRTWSVLIVHPSVPLLVRRSPPGSGPQQHRGLWQASVTCPRRFLGTTASSRRKGGFRESVQRYSSRILAVRLEEASPAPYSPPETGRVYLKRRASAVRRPRRRCQRAWSRLAHA